jgi:acyl carrier protein
MSSVAEKINTILTEEFELPEESLTADATLQDDLGLDSLDAVDLANRLEEQSGIRLEIRDLVELNTLGDLISLVEGLAKKA